mmetsp:Transcript_70884/g.196943  ORF Transcript_70884/g.196943 Transcript_70884/m.196943 type:complete len:234 (+) Transcript_70884:761-1462(+)
MDMVSMGVFLLSALLAGDVPMLVDLMCVVPMCVLLAPVVFVSAVSIVATSPALGGAASVLAFPPVVVKPMLIHLDIKRVLGNCVDRDAKRRPGDSHAVQVSLRRRFFALGQLRGVREGLRQDPFHDTASSHCVLWHARVLPPKVRHERLLRVRADFHVRANGETWGAHRIVRTCLGRGGVEVGSLECAALAKRCAHSGRPPLVVPPSVVLLRGQSLYVAAQLVCGDEGAAEQE